MQVSLSFKRGSHINQYIYGFMMLHKKGVLTITSMTEKSHCHDNILMADVDGLKMVFDGSDGDQMERGFFSLSDYNWCHVYYKRSYSDKLAEKFTKLRPVGFNYQITPDTSRLNLIKNSLKRLTKKETIKHYDLENTPTPSPSPRILFLTGLWDPHEDTAISDEINKITETRISVLNTLNKEFGKISTIGVNDTEFTRKVAKEYILPKKITSRTNFIKMLKTHEICITSTGMHNSVGWRFGEYVAASRAIISEKLHYSTVGDFKENENYTPFSCSNSLISAINNLLDKRERENMMFKNYCYYHQYLRPDMLILNSIVNAR